MSAYSNFLVNCPQDQSVAIHAAGVLEALAEAFETFRDKPQLDAVKDVHTTLLDWEELQEGYDPSTGTDITITVTTEEQSWFLDLATSEWILDLRMSIFHGRLIFMLNTEVEDTAA